MNLLAAGDAGPDSLGMGVLGRQLIPCQAEVAAFGRPDGGEVNILAERALFAGLNALHSAMDTFPLSDPASGVNGRLARGFYLQRRYAGQGKRDAANHGAAKPTKDTEPNPQRPLHALTVPRATAPRNLDERSVGKTAYHPAGAT